MFVLSLSFRHVVIVRVQKIVNSMLTGRGQEESSDSKVDPPYVQQAHVVVVTLRYVSELAHAAHLMCGLFYCRTMCDSK